MSFRASVRTLLSGLGAGPLTGRLAGQRGARSRVGRRVPQLALTPRRTATLRSIMRAHEAGALHGNDAAPTWLPYPQDVNHLIDGLWSRNTSRNAAGAVEIAGVDVHRIAEEVGTPAFVLDEDDFRHRARAFRDAFAEAFRPHRGADVYYAGKAFLCGAVARWVEEDGLGLDVCTGGELAVALRAGFPASRIALHGNNKSASEIRRALEAGVGRIVIDSLDEIDQVDEIAARLGLRAGVMLRVTTGVEAHTHEFIATAHEDQRFGISLTSGDAFIAVRQVLARRSEERRVGKECGSGWSTREQTTESNKDT